MNKTSKITLNFADINKFPIKNLVIGCTTGAKTWHQGKTDSKGSIHFSAPQGLDIIVSAKNWIGDNSRAIAKFYTGKEYITLKITSPKYKDTIRPRPAGAAGKYLRGTYVVKSGDTLSSIANAYNVGTDILIHMNHLRDANHLRINQTLKVPPVEARSSEPTPASNGQPEPTDKPRKKKDEQNGDDGKPTTRAQSAMPPIVFPLAIRPLNEVGGSFSWNDWTRPALANAACFGFSRENNRKHAARDLYAPDLSDIFAIAPGKVLRTGYFYCETYAISIHHKTADGREFLVRYGEVDPSSICIKVGDEVVIGQKIAKTGILKKKNGGKLIVTHDKNVSMLHFELFSGAQGSNDASNLTNTAAHPYQRRQDLIDPIHVLQEGYLNTFRTGQDTTRRQQGARKSIESLQPSDLGKDFIKSWEKYSDEYYNCSAHCCTVGWGHLVRGEKTCESIGIKPGEKITKEEAMDLFDADIEAALRYLKNAIKAPLYQHEFDALLSLTFNIGYISKKAPNLCKKINNLQYTEGANELLDITNNGTAGLVKRRKKEYALFTTANYDSTH